jgi:hypothetical protein
MSRTPTTRIAATTDTATSTARIAFRNPTGRPATRDHSSSVTTANSTRRSASIAATIRKPSPTTVRISASSTVSGEPKR